MSSSISSASSRAAPVVTDSKESKEPMQDANSSSSLPPGVGSSSSSMASASDSCVSSSSTSAQSSAGSSSSVLAAASESSIAPVSSSASVLSSSAASSASSSSASSSVESPSKVPSSTQNQPGVIRRTVGAISNAIALVFSKVLACVAWPFKTIYRFFALFLSEDKRVENLINSIKALSKDEINSNYKSWKERITQMINNCYSTPNRLALYAAAVKKVMVENHEEDRVKLGETFLSDTKLITSDWIEIMNLLSIKDNRTLLQEILKGKKLKPDVDHVAASPVSVSVEAVSTSSASSASAPAIPVEKTFDELFFELVQHLFTKNSKEALDFVNTLEGISDELKTRWLVKLVNLLPTDGPSIECVINDILPKTNALIKAALINAIISKQGFNEFLNSKKQDEQFINTLKGKGLVTEEQWNDLYKDKISRERENAAQEAANKLNQDRIAQEAANKLNQDRIAQEAANKLNQDRKIEEAARGLALAAYRTANRGFLSYIFGSPDPKVLTKDESTHVDHHWQDFKKQARDNVGKA